MSLTRKTSKLHRRTQQNLDKRPSNVVPVGAWVEVCSRSDVNPYEAVLAAEHEEERLLRLQAEKEAKLARFRQEVRSRVRELHRAKRQQQLQESFQAVELHGRVMHRTAPSANQLSHRKDACLYQNADPHAIGHGRGQGSIPGRSLHEGGGDGTGENAVGSLVSEQAGQTRRLVQKAKQDLASKQLVAKPRVDPSSVPGGLWGSSFSRDRPPTIADNGAGDLAHDPRSQVNDPETSSTHSDQRIPQGPIEGALYGDTHEFSKDRLRREEELQGQKRVTFAPGLRGSPQVTKQVGGHGDYLGVGEVNYELGGGGENAFEPEQSYVEISPSRAHMGDYTEVRVKGHDDDCERFKGHAIPEVNPGVVAEEHRRQHGLQFSMYRRLYMDIEREQVRENMRRKTHHKKIQQLKKTKEQERLEVEKQSQKMMQPSQTIESDAETRQREVKEAEEIKRIQVRLKQKNKETKRFIGALRAMMRERIALLGVNPPPLCACGPTVWDANPETCANNCIFYKNPKAYAKALASILTLNDTG